MTELVDSRRRPCLFYRSSFKGRRKAGKSFCLGVWPLAHVSKSGQIQVKASHPNWLAAPPCPFTSLIFGRKPLEALFFTALSFVFFTAFYTVHLYFHFLDCNISSITTFVYPNPYILSRPAFTLKSSTIAAYKFPWIYKSLWISMIFVIISTQFGT